MRPGMALLALILLAAACGSAAKHYPGRPETLGTSITISHLYCQWDGSHVKIHATVHNYGGDTSLSVIPIYWTADGSHGDSFEGETNTGFPDAPHGTTHLTIDAGKPEGVKQGARIVKCQPHFSD